MPTDCRLQSYPTLYKQRTAWLNQSLSPCPLMKCLTILGVHKQTISLVILNLWQLSIELQKSLSDNPSVIHIGEPDFRTVNPT